MSPPFAGSGMNSGCDFGDKADSGFCVCFMVRQDGRPPGCDGSQFQNPARFWPARDNFAPSKVKPQFHMSSEQWCPAYRWSESLRVNELLAVFRFEQHAWEFERATAYDSFIASRSSDPELRDSKWARRLLGYKGKCSSTFWQFGYSQGVPHIRFNSRRIMFTSKLPDLLVWPRQATCVRYSAVGPFVFARWHRDFWRDWDQMRPPL